MGEFGGGKFCNDRSWTCSGLVLEVVGIVRVEGFEGVVLVQGFLGDDFYRCSDFLVAGGSWWCR